MREDLTFSYSGFFTGAYRDIPLAQGRAGARDVRVSEGGTSYTPGGNTALGSSDAAGRFGFVRLPQGLRIVWHYQQDGGRADVHAALPPARRRDRPRRRRRGGAAGLGRPVEGRAPLLLANMQRRGCATGHARLDRAGVARSSRDRAPRRRADRRRRRAGPAQRDPARALPALGARAGRAVRAARARRHPARDGRARAGRRRPRSARQAPARGHAPPPAGRGSSRCSRWRSCPHCCSRRSPTGASAASTRPGPRRSTCTSRPTTSRRRSCRRCSRSASSPAATSSRPRSSSSCAAAASR